jgi:hypothetical protein
VRQQVQQACGVADVVVLQVERVQLGAGRDRGEALDRLQVVALRDEAGQRGAGRDLAERR